jgi:hypothetical protein
MGGGKQAVSDLPGIEEANGTLRPQLLARWTVIREHQTTLNAKR